MKLRLAALALMALTACSQTSQSTASSSATAPATTNPIAFPLYSDSTLVSTRAWTEAVDRRSTAKGGVFGEGAGLYSGHEVIAKSAATMAQIRAWLAQLALRPPTGYDVAVEGNTIDEARARAQAVGLDFNTFEQFVNGKRHAVVVIAIDPQQLDRKAGSLIGLIGKYQMLPQMLRDPLDAQAKARTGFTISQALDPNSPIGAALAALATLRASGDRGIIVLDATKH